MYKIIGVDGNEYGPVTPEQLRQWIAEGRVHEQTKVQVEGGTEWRILGGLPEFAAVLSPASQPKPPLPPRELSAMPPATQGHQPSAKSKPGKLQAIAIMTLVCGIINLLLGAYWFFAGLAVFLVGVVFTIIPASYMTVLGILEIINASKLLSDPVRVAEPPKFVAVMEIIAIIFCNVIALIIGILNLVFYNDEDVQQYFASRA